MGSFSGSWTRPHKGKIETLRFKEDPRKKGLGEYVDVDGKRWDICAIRGKYVNAREVLPGCYNGYYDTLTDGYGPSGTNTFNPVHTWVPYNIEVV